MDVQKPRHTRTRQLVIRLTEAERKMLDRVTKKLGLSSVSEAFRFLMKREDDRGRGGT
jgi:hypothetical protein